MKTRLTANAKPAAVIAIAAMAALPFFLVGADSVDSRPATLVTVQGPVEVQGVVEVLNDVLRQPYTQQQSATASESPTVNFDIPDGKRLVIESIAFQASTPTNEANRMFFQPLVNTTRLLVPLAIQATSVEGGVTYLLGNHSFKVRVNSVPGSTTEIQVRRGTGGTGTVNAAILGYLVDL